MMKPDYLAVIGAEEDDNRIKLSYTLKDVKNANGAFFTSFNVYNDIFNSDDLIIEILDVD